MSFTIDAFYTVLLGFFTLLGFGLSTLSYSYFQKYSRNLTVVSFIYFSLFWVSLFPYYVFETRSIVYGVLIGLGVPFVLYIAYQYYQDPDAYNTMESIVTAIFIASILYAPFEFYEPLKQASIEFVSYQSYQVIQVLGIESNLTIGPNGYRSSFSFPQQDGTTIQSYVEPACTGIGSMSILVALVSITKSKISTKLVLSTVFVVFIHILNIGRNVLIAVGYGKQLFQIQPELLAGLLGYQSTQMVSFFIADKIISQLLSAIVLIILIYSLTILIPSFKQQLIDFTDEWISV